ncbi:membrane hypothetical protein [Candidatus Zixiibacteriota bacterium]|nr:membrane hypothetical protein [candidate division Zixibacteria bacterium]
MAGLMLSALGLLTVVGLSLFLVYRLKVLVSQAAGRGYLLIGLSLLSLAAGVNFLQHFSGYPNWFLQNIYQAIEIAKFILLILGAVLTTVGLALHFSYFGDRDLEVANQLEKYRLLDNLQQDSREPFPMAELLERVLKTLLGGLGEDAGAIFLLNRTQRQFVLTTASGLSKDEVSLLEYYPYGRNLVSEAVEEEAPALSADFRRLGGKAQLAASRFHSILVMPLISGRNKLGALLLFAEDEGRFSREYLTILGPIVNWLSEKIEVNRLGRDLGKSQRELEQRRFRLEGFYEKLHKIIKPGTEIPTPEKFAERCLGLLDAEEVWLLGLINGHLQVFGGTATVDGFSESFQAALLGAIAKSKPVILNQEATDESGHPYIARSSLLFPCGSKGPALLLRNGGGAMHPGEDDLKLLELVAGMAGMAAGNAIIKSADETRGRSYEIISRVLRMKLSEVEIEKDLKEFVSEATRTALPQSIFILYRKQQESYRAVYSNASGEGLNDLSVALGEGLPGQAAIIKNGEIHIGVEAVAESLGRYDEDNRNILFGLFGERRRPAMHAGYPIFMGEQAEYFMEVFGFDDSPSENIEWHRLISVLVGLLNLRLEILKTRTIGQRAVSSGESLLTNDIINDLNNDLAAISGFCQLARRDPNMSGETGAALDAILKSSRKMADRIRSSVPETGEIPAAEKSRTDIGTAIKEHLTRNRISGDLYMISGRPFEVHLNLNDAAPIPFDREIFDRFLESFSRAFTAGTGEDEIITFNTYQKADYLYLDISRHRKNFPPVEAVAGFGRFLAPRDVEGDLKNAAFMTQLILFNGEFAFDKFSQTPSYYSFRFRLSSGTATADDRLNGERALTILAVDDQVVILELLAAMCQSIGYRILTARNGTDGLVVFEAHRPDIVIADLVMPGMSGLELSGRIKKISPDTPIIIITGWGVTVDGRKLEEAGVKYLLNKPFRLEQLSDLIEQIKASKA